jgi:hypothetical protein
MGCRLWPFPGGAELGKLTQLAGTIPQLLPRRPRQTHEFLPAVVTPDELSV